MSVAELTSQVYTIDYVAEKLVGIAEEASKKNICFTTNILALSKTKNRHFRNVLKLHAR